MGHGTRGTGEWGDHKIKTFTPDNTQDTLYLRGNITLIEMVESIRAHFPNSKYEDLTISSEHIQTDCLGYDRYDPGDYTDYIVVTK